MRIMKPAISMRTYFCRYSGNIAQRYFLHNQTCRRLCTNRRIIFSPIVGKILRQSSEKFLANRRKNLVSFVSMGYTKDHIGVKMVSALSPSAASKIKSFSDSFPGGSVTAVVLLKRLARLILSASLRCCTVRRFSFRLRSYTRGLSHNRSCLF